MSNILGLVCIGLVLLCMPISIIVCWITMQKQRRRQDYLAARIRELEKGA